MAINLVAFVGSLIFSIGAVILIKALVQAFNIPVFATVTIAIFGSYILMFFSVLLNILSKSQRRK